MESLNSQNSDYDIRVLNGLIATTIDSVDGYREAANDVDNDQFRSMFLERADERDDVATRLQEQVRILGGTPEDDGTALAGAHRMFMNLRDAVTGTNDTGLVAEVERGEDHIKAKFDEAMADADLSIETKAIVEDCYTSVREGHDQMRDLKHGMTGDSSYANEGRVS
jgi:uncharacterized protein (TIGR02284 family)